MYFVHITVIEQSGGIGSSSGGWPTNFFQYCDAVGWVFWPVKRSPGWPRPIVLLYPLSLISDWFHVVFAFLNRYLKTDFHIVLKLIAGINEEPGNTYREMNVAYW